MPPKKDVPKGLKEFLEKPENVEKRKQAIAKNKEVREAKKMAVKEVKPIVEKKPVVKKVKPMDEKLYKSDLNELKELKKKYNPAQEQLMKEALITFLASANKKNLFIPPELIEKIIVDYPPHMPDPSKWSKKMIDTWLSEYKSKRDKIEANIKEFEASKK
jgi:hypothetical protein